MSVLDQFKLDGRRALVTGGARGLGRVMAEALAEAGADVALTSRTPDSADRAATEIARATGRDVRGYASDVQHGPAVVALATEVEGSFGPVDILVNNAGINVRGPSDEIAEADWDAVIDTNL